MFLSQVIATLLLMKTQQIHDYLNEINNAVEFLRAAWPKPPAWCVILGSGLGGLAEKLNYRESPIKYPDIPGFPGATVAGHAGTFNYGTAGNIPIAVAEGRFHMYEGHSAWTVTLPVRVMVELGVTHFLLTNAAGGIRDDLVPGDFMILEDHLNLMGTNPLMGPNLDDFGPRFPAMTHCYDPGIRKIISDTFQETGSSIKSGIYAALTGPAYETAAEITMLKTLGADAVGMSTVPEAIAIRHAGRKVAAISLVTNATGTDHVPTHQEVVDMAAKRRQTLHTVILKVIAACSHA